MSRAEQKEKRRGEILEAALDQFIRRGYAGTKIKDIADAAGMSVGLLFHYFDSKEALYTELIEIGASAPQDMIAGFAEKDALSFFTLCAQSTLRFAAESPFTAKMFVLMGSAYYTEGIPQKAREVAYDIDFYTGLAPIIEQGQKEGTIRKGDPVSLSTTFWTALQGSIEVFALNPELSLPNPEWIIDIIKEKRNQ